MKLAASEAIRVAGVVVKRGRKTKAKVRPVKAARS